MLVLLATLAHAAPIALTGIPGPGIELSATTRTERTWVDETGCTGGGCEAWRAAVLHGGAASVGVVRGVALYGDLAWLNEAVDAARYGATGYAAGGGVRGELPLTPALGLQAWAGLARQASSGTESVDAVVSTLLDTGLVVRGGAPEDGAQAWVGIGAVPWSAQSATLLDAALQIDLEPHVPVELVFGGELASMPLGGPWNGDNRLAIGIDGSIGYRTGIGAHLSLHL